MALEAGTEIAAVSEKSRSAPRALWAAVALIALAVVIYAPILYYMVIAWKVLDDYSHGFLIVSLALYFAWERRPQLRRAVIESSWWGVLPLCLGTLTLTIGRLGVELMNMRVSFVLTLIGLVLLLLGKQVFRILAFPLLFLFLMVPLPQVSNSIDLFQLAVMSILRTLQSAPTAVGWFTLQIRISTNWMRSTASQ